jgi:hypothetical protein
MYGEGSLSPVSVKEATMQYVTRYNASARSGPCGRKPAANSRNTSIRMLIATPTRPTS